MASLRKLYRWCRRIWFPSVLEFAAHSPRRGRSNANRETDQPLSLSSTDKLDYIEESRTVFLTQIQKSRSNQISIKCTRISIEENRLLFRCSWNGSSWTMGSLETCKMKKEMRETWLDKQFSDQLSALSIRMEIRIRRPPCWFYFPRLFWLPPPVPSSAALIYFPRSFRLPYTSRDVLFAIPLTETLSSHRRVSSRFFFFFFFPPRLIQLGQRNFYPPLSPSARFWTSVFNELRWLLQRFYRSLPVYLGPSG